ncbi:C4-dicarboxylate ABC transporter [Rathayibacter sp. AY1F3]|uniref:SLC13 family permease n=1 Tax=unclassified Rathayibacter TaxID=2609250 RepID=UPI000CE772D0|nr:MULTISPECIES: SLC13 family permease [unclassified Rathayibacter]PPG08120.1 C4-dicarboxylate ABC transporter [Rathayibacter sp. AY2B1]PPG60946.1 C4-dicarboxylate ABC transporter [Rathayibacter sp. AY2B7]PPG68285.1 C4-dicarboxylate ABC transporter [Rathayibacter sp. AY1F4]PPG87439.1 C4-dicarboxylate ABC transporter [Rathayibacter sp. AY1F3]
MSSIEIIPLIGLVVMFVIATVFPINIGFLGFIGAFLVGAIAFGYDDKEILEVFPASIVLTIIGVTYFFGMAKQNGTIDLMVNACIRAVRGRVYLIPWVFFLVAAFLTSLGTFSPAAVALIAPAAMSFAGRTRMSPLVMGIMTINGAHAGAFSPISVSGVLVRGIVEDAGLTLDPWQLFLSSFGINTLLSVLTVVVYAVASRVRTLEYTATGSIRTVGPNAVEAERIPLTRTRLLTLVLIAAILLIVLVLHQPISFVAIAAGVLLSFTDLKNTSRSIAGISWPTVLLVAGMVTYIAMLEELGTIDDLADMALLIGAPLLVALVLCYVIGISSAFASSTALLAAIIPLSLPLLQLGELPVVGVVAALSIAATVVDVSPFSTNGALVLANAQNIDRGRFYRQLLVNAGIVVAIAPAICWLLLVVVPSALA